MRNYEISSSSYTLTFYHVVSLTFNFIFFSETQQVTQEEEDKITSGRKSKKSESDDKPSKAGKSKKKAKEVDDDDENDDEIATQTVSAFNLLNIDDDGDDDGANELVEEDTKKAKKKKDKKKEPANEEAPAKKDKKKKKKADEEDWDAILAEYQDDKGGANKVEEEVDTKKKKKTKGDTSAVPAPAQSSIDVETESAPAKEETSTTSKKKDKKKKNKADDASDAVENESVSKELPETTEIQGEKSAEAGGESAAAKKKKGPNKAMVAAMQEALKKKKEEEERLMREEEEKIRLIEEAERIKKEKERLEQEKKELKKQKEKEKRERLKAEGKLLSAKQKADKARAELLLKSLRDQGVDVPEIGEKRDARPSARSMRSSKPTKKVPSQTDVLKKESEEPKVDQPPQEQEKPVEIESPQPVEPPKEEIKDSWDVSSGEEDDEEDSVEQTSEEKVEESNVAEENESDDEEESESEDSDSSDEEDSESSGDEKEPEPAERRHGVEKDPPEVRIRKREVEAEKKRTVNELRAAVVCVLGHVDTGKTKILDKLRRTNVQDGEAGGITQQIGATNVPIENIKENTKYVKGASEMDYKVPGLLIIDTPGHESFSNLRNRGSSLCDIAILVVDIMHGLEPQTIESLNLLKSRKTPFVVALNKIDRLYDWNTMQRKDVQDIIKAQSQNTQNEFEKRTKEVILQFNEQGLNAALYYENTDPRTFVSLVPTSAITGEGMGNLLMLIVQFSQNQLAKRLAYSEQLQATILEVKAIQGLGTTIDAILINGKLREGDTMIVAGTDGPIVTQIRALLLPHPMKELRVKNNYIEQKEIKGAQGVKIAAKELEKAIAGINLQIAQEPDEVEYFK